MKSLIRKAVVTAMQGALIAWSTSGFSFDTDWRPILGAALGALLSFCYNIPRDYRKKLGIFDGTSELATLAEEHTELLTISQTDNSGKFGDGPLPEQTTEVIE